MVRFCLLLPVQEKPRKEFSTEERYNLGRERLLVAS